MATVTVLEANFENARRLHEAYQSAYRSDAELLERVCGAARASQGIDGVTEPLAADDMHQAMSMRYAVTLEALDRQRDSRGFVIVSYADRSPAAIQAFRGYFLEEVFPSAQLEFASALDRGTLEEALAAGNIAYFTEFVASDPRTAMALVATAYQEVVRARMGADHCCFVGKCLDEAQIGECRNTWGNHPVRALAAHMGLRRIAAARQTRWLAGESLEAMPAFAHASGSASPIPCTLTFGLYFGESQAAAAWQRRKRERDARRPAASGSPPRGD